MEMDWKDPRFLEILKEEGIWFGESPVMTFHDQDKIVYASSYYYVGHFSKFVQRGARRIGCSSYTQDVEMTAFSNPDGTKVLVAMNTADEARKAVIRFHEEIADYELAPHSIATFVF